MKSVAVVTNILPHYREGFYRELLRDPTLKLTIFCQQSIPGLPLDTVHAKFPKQIRLVKYVGLTREACGWQCLPWLELLRKFDVLFVLGNPRIFSNVVVSILAKLCGTQVVIWGQAHTAGASRFTESLRLLWWRMFDRIFTYTDREISMLECRGFFGKKIVGMNNGLDQSLIEDQLIKWSPERLDEWRRLMGLAGKKILLSCARLEPKNGFEKIPKMLALIRKDFPNLVWCVIGEGAEREHLDELVRANQLQGTVRFLGKIMDETALAPWFLSSEVLIHPTGVGLSLIHAYGYGLPAILGADADRHMPEFAAFMDSHAGRVFNMEDTDDFSKTVVEALADQDELFKMRERARTVVREKYNTHVMAARFKSLCEA